MISLPGKFRCSALEWFSCPEGISPNSGLTWPNITYRYIYISDFVYFLSNSLGKYKEQFPNQLISHITRLFYKLSSITPRPTINLHWQWMKIKLIQMIIVLQLILFLWSFVQENVWNFYLLFIFYILSSLLSSARSGCEIDSY